MNEKIKQLAEQAGMGYGNLTTGNGDNWIVAGKPEELEKFAELLLEESIKVMMANDYHGEWLGEKLKEHFGVES